MTRPEHPIPTPPHVRTADVAFEKLPELPFAPRYLEWRGLRVHHLDEGAREAPVALLVHGEPTWSFLYRRMVPPLVRAGYRCVVPDHVGFGRSDKVTDDAWYVIERHVERLRHLIETLDLRRITLFVQDWGGPIGLRQAVDLPERFERLVILNTWLHHEGFDYTPTIRTWREMSQDPARLGGDMPTGRVVAGTLQRPGHDKGAVVAAYDAPYAGLGPEAKAGARRFPWCLPFAEPEAGNAADQARCFAALPGLGKPVHVIFGDADPIFTAGWGRAWAARIPGATFDAIPGAGHFVQEEAGPEIVETFLRRAGG